MMMMMRANRGRLVAVALLYAALLAATAGAQDAAGGRGQEAIAAARETLRAARAEVNEVDADRRLAKAERELKRAEGRLASGNTDGALKHAREAEKLLAAARGEEKR